LRSVFNKRGVNLRSKLWLLKSAGAVVVAVLSFSFLEVYSVNETKKAQANPVEDWSCTPKLQGDGVSSLPVCVSASYLTLTQMASSPLIWWDKDGRSQNQSDDCTKPLNQSCASSWISSGGRIGGVQVMPPCDSGGSPSYCIREIVLSVNGTGRALSYVGDDPRLETTELEGVGLQGSVELGIPRGGKTGFWRDSISSELFFVSVVSWYQIGRDLDKSSSERLQANVIRTDAIVTKVPFLPKSSSNLIDFKALKLSPEMNFAISLSFPAGWGGFAGARIADMEFAVTKQQGFSELLISGKPIEVSGANVLVKKPSTEWDYILGNSYPANGGASVSTVPYLSRAEAFQSLTQDTATGSQMIWGFNLYPSQLWCRGERIEFPGYSASNALFQDSSVPTFSGGEFTYRAGDFHRKQDGSINRGVYSFGIDSDLARCLYGFNQAPISATISITNEGGERETAVTRVYSGDGLLRLEASNFTYSVKTIRTKITQVSSNSIEVKSFASCKALNREFKGGVAKSKKSKNLGRTAKFKAAVNRKVYIANSKLDRDKDGIACER